MVSFLLKNKLIVLKVVMVIVLAASTLVLMTVRKPQEKPEVLGKETALIPTPAPTMPPFNPLKAAEDAVSGFLDTSIKSTKQLTNDLIGEATQVVQNAASSSAQTATKIVYQSAVEAIMKQIDKLPETDRKEIKSLICK